jgi:hypothetical protein
MSRPKVELCITDDLVRIRTAQQSDVNFGRFLPAAGKL